MTARRTARAASTSRPDVDHGEAAIPDELRAGPCIEVWTTDTERTNEYGRPFLARRRYFAARTAWLEAHGIDPRDARAVPRILHYSARPWSFTDLQREDPDRLATELQRRGLPADWQPSPPAPGHRPR